MSVESIIAPVTTAAAPATLVEPTAKQRYADFGRGTPGLSRHPDDGWILADPIGLGRPGRVALRGLIRILCPPAPAPQLPDLEDRIEMQTRRLLRYMPRPVSFLMKVVFRLLDQMPRLLLVSRRRLHKLPHGDARQIIHRLASSRFGPVRELAGAARSLILSVYFDQDEVHEAMGYAPIPFMRSRIALRQRLLAGQEADENDLIPVTPGLEATMPL